MAADEVPYSVPMSTMLCWKHGSLFLKAAWCWYWVMAWLVSAPPPTKIELVSVGVEWGLY